MGVLFIRRGVAYHKMGLHEILFISTVGLLQPPPTIVHPRAPVDPASTVRYFTDYCSTSPLHGLLLNHPSTGYCSSSPPPAIVQPALHRVVLFIQPSTGSCSSTPNRLDRDPVHPEATPRGLVHPPPPGTVHPTPPQQCSLFNQRQHRSASDSSSSEGIARSGSVNSHRSLGSVTRSLRCNRSGSVRAQRLARV